MKNAGDTLLSVEHLKKYYPVKNRSLFSREKKYVHAVDDISFTIGKGETLGLVGESGCGKSTSGRVIVGIEKPTSGRVSFEGSDMEALSGRGKKPMRTDLQMIFQDSYASLNPRKRVVDILADPMVYHHIVSKDEADGKVRQLLELVGLPANAAARYPHEFSGGQRQRISIARAVSLNPKLIICDEPVSALDVSIQAQILNLLLDLQKKTGISYLFIAHGLAAVHYISDRIAVMYLGKIVELGDSYEVFSHPLHPYAQSLIAAVPVADPTRRQENFHAIEGEVPDAVDLPRGCRFAGRCPFADAHCREEEPALQNYPDSSGEEHLAACFHVQGR